MWLHHYSCNSIHLFLRIRSIPKGLTPEEISIGLGSQSSKSRGHLCKSNTIWHRSRVTYDNNPHPVIVVFPLETFHHLCILKNAWEKTFRSVLGVSDQQKGHETNPNRFHWIIWLEGFGDVQEQQPSNLSLQNEATKCSMMWGLHLAWILG